MGLQENWEDFLDWATERGVPLRDAADWLEGKGVPSLPFFALLLLLILAGAYFMAAPALLAPKVGDLKVTLTATDGTPLQGATVKVTSTAGSSSFAQKTGQTDAQGVVTFSGLPSTEQVHVSAFYPDYKNADAFQDIAAGKVAEVSLSTAPVALKKVTVSMEVSGPTDPDKVTTVLYDELWNPLFEPAKGFKPAFTLDANATFHVKISAPGFTDKTLTNQVSGSGDSFLGAIALQAIPTAKRGTVKAFVFEIADGKRKPVPAAQVEVRDAATRAMVANLATADDGMTQTSETDLGQVVVVKASRDGYAANASYSITVAADTTVEVQVRKAEGPSTLHVEVYDSAADGAKLVENPLLRLYSKTPSGQYSIADEEKPFDGTYDFKADSKSSYALSAYAPGFLPLFIPSVSGPQKKIALAKATAQNSGRLKAHAGNYDGSDAGGASIALYSKDRTPLGTGERITGPDGVQYFDDVPATALVAVASVQGRLGEAAFAMQSGNASVEISLARGTGKARLLVLDHYGLKPVSGARVALSIAGLPYQSAPSTSGTSATASAQASSTASAGSSSPTSPTGAYSSPSPSSASPNAPSLTCVTDSAGTCLIDAPEGQGATAVVRAGGYDDFFTSSFAITANSEAKVRAELIPSALASGTRMEFAGFYDLAGNRVGTLAPASQYRARFILRAAPIDFDEAHAFVSIGSAGDSLASKNAVIVGFDAPGAGRVLYGADFEAARNFVPPALAALTAADSLGAAGAAGTNPSAQSPSSTGQQNPSSSPSPTSQSAASQLSPFPPVVQTSVQAVAQAATQNANQDASGKLAWVEAVFGKFSGTREISVIVQTAQVTAGKATLNYRTAYVAGAGTEAPTVLRNPDDADAGVKKSELLANALSESANIGFEGICQNGLCVAASFEQDGTAMPVAGFESEVGKQFYLRVLVLGANGTSEAALQSAGISINVENAQSGGVQSLPVKADDDSSTASIPISGNGVSFSLRSQRVSNNAALALTLKKDGTVAYQKTFFVRVNSQGVQSLSVSYSPLSLTALVPSQVKVKVRDSLGIPVGKARVVLGGVQDDALGRVVEAVEDPAERGTYVADAISPSSVGGVALSAEASGFSISRTRIPVTAKNFIAAKEAGVELSVAAKGEVASAPVTVENLLENEVGFSISVSKDSIPKILDISALPQESVRVPARGAFNALLQARISDFVLGLSQKGGQLEETVRGRVRVSASAGGVRQAVEIPFVASAKISQQPIDSSWRVDVQSVEIKLSPPLKADGLQLVTVSNDAPHPLLVNEELSSLRGLRIEPLSLEIPPGQSGSFTLTASADPASRNPGSCIFDESRQGGTLALWASFQGLTSKRTLPVSLTIGASGTCMPPNPVRVTLPLTLRITAPADAKVRPNDDGSTAMQLSSGSLIAFSSESVVQGQGRKIEVPFGKEIIVEAPQAVLDLATQVLTLTLPVASSLVVPADVAVVNANGKSVVLLGSLQVSLPQSASFSGAPGASEGRTVSIPASTPIIVSPLGRLDTRGNAMARIPIPVRLSLPANTIASSNPDSTFSAQLPSGAVFGFPAEAVRQTANSDGSLEVSLPANAPLLLPPSVMSAGASGGYSVKFPIPVALELDRDIQLAQRSGSIVAFLPGFDLSLPSDAQISQGESVRVAAIQPNAQFSFTPIDLRAATSRNSFYSLPVALILSIPPDARYEEAGGAKTIALFSGEVISLSPDASVGSQELDGSRQAFIPASSKASFPQGYITYASDGGFVLRPALPYSIGIPAGTKIVEAQSEKIAALPSYDLHLSKSAALTPKGQYPGLLFTDALSPSASTRISAVPEIRLESLSRLTLPFDATVPLPFEARAKQTTQGVAVLLPDGTPVGFSAPAELALQDVNSIGSIALAPASSSNPGTSNAQSQPNPSSASNAFSSFVRIPAGSALLLPGGKFSVAGGAAGGANGAVSATLPYALVISFDESVQVLRAEKATVLVGDSFKATIPSSAKLTPREKGGTALLQAGMALSIEPKEFFVLGEERTLPLELAVALPQGALSRTRPDGQVYAEFPGARGLFGTGSVLQGNVVRAPENTPVVFTPGVIIPIRASSLSASVRDYRFVLPTPYSFVLPASGKTTVQKDGTTLLELKDIVVAFPRTGRITTDDKGISIASMPANAVTNFYAAVGGVPAGQVGQVVEQTAKPPNPIDEIHLAARANRAFVLPAQLSIDVPPALRVSKPEDTGGIIGVWLSSDEVITFATPAELSPASATGIATVVAPQGTQVSVPDSPDFFRPLPNGAFSFSLPMRSQLGVPLDAEILSTQTGHSQAVLQDANLVITLPRITQFVPSAGSNVAEVPPNTQVQVQPLGQISFDGNVAVSLPLDVTLSIPPSGRVVEKGGGVTVFLPDGSVAQFPGASAQKAGASSSRTIQWPQGTNALLPPNLVAERQNGGREVVMPFAATVILPQESRIVRRGGSLIATVQGLGTQIILTGAGVPTRDARGIVATVPAGGRITSAPFGLNVLGPALILPFEIQMELPPDALVDENAPGGLAVEFAGGMRAKFSGASLTTPTAVGAAGLGGFGGLGGLGFPSGFNTFNAFQPFAGQFASPFANPGGIPYQSPYSALAASASQRSNVLLVPSSSQIVLTPQLYRPLAFDSWSSFGQAASYEFSLPAAFKAVVRSQSAFYNNPDGTLSVFDATTEIRFPPGSSPAPLSQLSGGVGVQQLYVPGFAPVRVLPIYSGRIAGDHITLPFELTLQLGAASRVLPLAPDGSRTVDFGNGGRVVFDRDLIVDARKVQFGQQGVRPQLSEVLIQQGDTVTFSPGIVSPLPASAASLREQSLVSSAGFPAYSLALPVPSTIKVPGDAKAYANADGSTSVILSDTELRLPAGVSPPLREKGDQGMQVYSVQAGGRISVIPLILSQVPAGGRVAFSLPIDALLQIPPTARVLPKAQDGTFIVQFTRGTITFNADMAVKAEGISLPAGTVFYPSQELLSTSSSADSRGTKFRVLKFTAPANIILTSSTSPIDNADSTKSILEGATELIIPKIIPVEKTADASGKERFASKLAAGALVQVQPIDASIGSNLEPVFLPADAVFSIPDNAKVFQAGNDGTLVVKLGDGLGIIFGAGNTLNSANSFAGSFAGSQSATSTITAASAAASAASLGGGTRSVSVPQGVSISPSYAMFLPLAARANSASKLRRENSAYASGWRLLLPLGLTLTVAGGKAVAPEDRGYVIAGDFDELLLPKNARPVIDARNNRVTYSLPAFSTIELHPIDFSTDGLQEIKSFPAKAQFSLPGARQYSDPQTQATIFQLRGGGRIAFPQGGMGLSGFAGTGGAGLGSSSATGPSNSPFSSRLGADKMISVEEGSNFLIQQEWASATPDGYSLIFPFAWNIFYSPKAQIAKVGAEYALKLENGVNVFIPGIGPAGAQAASRFAQFSPSTGFSGGSGQNAFGQLQSGSSNPSQQGGSPSALGPASLPGLGAPSTRSAASSLLSLSIPAGTPVRFSFAETSLVSLTGERPGQLVLKAPFRGYIDVGSATVEQRGGAAVATMQSCASPVVFETTSATTRRAILPQSIQVTVTNARVRPSLAAGDRKFIEFSSGAQITLAACNPTDESARQITMFFPTITRFILPLDSVGESPTSIASGVVTFPEQEKCRQVSEFAGSQEILGLVGGTEKMQFGNVGAAGCDQKRPSNDACVDDRRDFEIEHEKTHEAHTKPAVDVKTGKPVVFTLCANPSSVGTVKVNPGSAEGTPQLLAEADSTEHPDELQFAFTDGTDGLKPQSMKAKLTNLGAVGVNLLIDQTAFAGTAGSQGWFDVKNIAWFKAGGSDKNARDPFIPGVRTEPGFVDVVATIPLDAGITDPVTGCVTQDHTGENAITGTVKFSGKQQAGATPGAAVQSNELKIKIEVKKDTGKCENAAELNRRLRLNGFHVTHASSIDTSTETQTMEGGGIFFKTPEPGQTQYFAIVNNLITPISLSAKWPEGKAGGIICRIVPDSTDISKLNAGIGPSFAGPEIDGQKLQKGTSALAACSPAAELPKTMADGKQQIFDAELSITGTVLKDDGAGGAKTDDKTVVTVRFNVFKPDAQNGAYAFYKATGSPQGMLCPTAVNSLSCPALTRSQPTIKSIVTREPPAGANANAQENKPSISITPGTPASGAEQKPAAAVAEGNENCQFSSESGAALSVPGGHCASDAQGADAAKLNNKEKAMFCEGNGAKDSFHPRDICCTDPKIAMDYDKATKSCVPKKAGLVQDADSLSQLSAISLKGDGGGKRTSVLQFQSSTPVNANTGTPAGSTSAFTADFTRCGEYFCSNEQVAETFKSHISALRDAMDGVFISHSPTATDLKAAETFTKSVGGSVVKTLVVQKAGPAAVSKDDLAKAGREAFSGWKWLPAGNGVRIDGEDLSSCGIYLIETRVNLPDVPSNFFQQGANDHFAWLNAVNFNSKIRKVASCDGKISNFALLSGEPRATDQLTDPEVIVGREQVSWSPIAVASRFGSKGLESISSLSILPFLGAFQTGPYGGDDSKDDERVAISAFNALYNQDVQARGDEFGFVKSTYYDGPGFCTQHGISQLGTVFGGGLAVTAALTTAAGAATLAGLLPLAGALGWFATYTGKALASGGITCGISLIPSGAGATIHTGSASGGECRVINSCVQNVFSSIILGGLSQSGFTVAKGATGAAAVTNSFASVGRNIVSEASREGTLSIPNVALIGAGEATSSFFGEQAAPAFVAGRRATFQVGRAIEQSAVPSAILYRQLSREFFTDAQFASTKLDDKNEFIKGFIQEWKAQVDGGKFPHGPSAIKDALSEVMSVRPGVAPPTLKYGLGAGVASKIVSDSVQMTRFQTAIKPALEVSARNYGRAAAKEFGELKFPPGGKSIFKDKASLDAIRSKLGDASKPLQWGPGLKEAFPTQTLEEVFTPEFVAEVEAKSTGIKKDMKIIDTLDKWHNDVKVLFINAERNALKGTVVGVSEGVIAAAKAKRLVNVLKGVGTLAQFVAALGVSANVKPVEALAYAGVSDIVVLHNPPGGTLSNGLPSVHRYCEGNAQGGCITTQVYENFCKADDGNKACVNMVQKADGRYTLVLGFNSKPVQTTPATAGAAASAKRPTFKPSAEDKPAAKPAAKKGEPTKPDQEALALYSSVFQPAPTPVTNGFGKITVTPISPT
ncbi:Ig-like domain-containing protein [Candidatus Micrarchaeota archaeon]|nr:Ig-like domain-containing protein [Candidatus Micrarchaeota archaeon]